jgi:AcrR family transcriptional regulator
MSDQGPVPAPDEPRSTDPRSRLLDDVIAYAGVHGLADTSLRQLAEGVGTSHRMLIHHFGSKEQLLVAVVHEVERRQRDAFVDLGRDTDDTAELGRLFWERLADPDLAPLERLFFELYSQALLDRPWARDFLDGIVEDWIGPVAELLEATGLDAASARTRARLSVAVSRGLLLDLLATGDRAGVDGAMADFGVLLATAGPARATPSS